MEVGCAAGRAETECDGTLRKLGRGGTKRLWGGCRSIWAMQDDGFGALDRWAGGAGNAIGRRKAARSRRLGPVREGAHGFYE